MRDTDESDDPAFLAIVAGAVRSLVEEHDSNEFAVIRIRNWFDHKWLRFSGHGRVAWHSVRDEHPQAALAPFHREKVTFPPFAPNRVLMQQAFKLPSVRAKYQVHSTYKERSHWNLQRRVLQYTQDGFFVWYSSNSAPNGQGSLMVYVAKGGSVTTWYASLRHADGWALDRVKGASREYVQALLLPDESAPDARVRPDAAGRSDGLDDE
ncbi:MAG: hypothetical protein ACYTFI_05075 [Planctomycetota bacterium]